MSLTPSGIRFSICLAYRSLNIPLRVSRVFALGCDIYYIPFLSIFTIFTIFVVKQKILYNDLKKELLDFNPLIKAVEIFDVYAGDKLETGQKSLAFHLTYQAEDRTLRAVEIDKLQAELIARLAKKFSAKLEIFKYK